MKEIVLNRKKIYIMPTVYGMLFILVLFGMLIGSLNYNNNLGFMLTFLLGGMSFISILHTFGNLFEIQILSVNAAPAYAGENAKFDIAVRAVRRKRFAVSFSFSEASQMTRDMLPEKNNRGTSVPIRHRGILNLDKFFFRFSKESQITCDLLPDKDNPVGIHVATRHRGILKLEKFVVSTTYPFGLFRAWSTLPISAETVVYPSPIHANPIFSGDISSGDGQSSANIPGVEDFEGLRPYKPGDPPGHISWKTFSGGRGLFVKSFVGQSGSKLLLDWDMMKEPHAEQKLSMLCGMIVNAHNLRMIYGLRLPGQSIEPSSGEAHKHRCLRALALY